MTRPPSAADVRNHGHLGVPIISRSYSKQLQLLPIQQQHLGEQCEIDEGPAAADPQPLLLLQALLLLMLP
jgi:hypothetical protein